MLGESELLKKAQPETYLKFAFIVLFTVLIGTIILLSWVPPVSRDALTHHLAVPKLYLQHGGIYEIPSIAFSYYPMNLDLLYIIPLYFGSDITPKFIHFIFGLLTAWLIYGYLVKKLGAVWALLGALFFLSLPIIIKLSITAYVDLGLVFFSTASILSLLKWIDSRFQMKFLILSAVWCGLALGTKYNGLLVLFILTLFIPFVFISNSKKAHNGQQSGNRGESKKNQFKAVGFGATFCAVALLVFSPWMIRNYIWTGNPVYPLYDSVFQDLKTGSKEPAHKNSANSQAETRIQESQNSSTRWGPFAIRKVIYGESWWEIALIPARIFFQGQDDHPKYFDGKLSPFLFFLPFLAFIQLKNNPESLQTEKKILAFFAILYLLYAFSQYSIRIRYIAPIIPPLVILATFGLHQIAGRVTNPRAGRSGWIGAGCILLIVTILLTYNALYILYQFSYVNPINYITGKVSRDAYIAKYRPEYKIYQYANQHLSGRAKILGLFLGNRRYYNDRELIFGVDEFKDIVNSAESEKLLLNNLSIKGYTHLIIRYDLFNQWTNTQFDDNKKQMIKILFAGHAKHLLSQDGYGLFELRNIQ